VTEYHPELREELFYNPTTMQPQYGIIKHPTADEKQVDRSVGICAAIRYLSQREKITPELLDNSLKLITQRGNNNCVAIVAPSL
jgi:hypothetical protein